MRPRKMSDGDYHRWRASVPFTNDQIADAIIESRRAVPNQTEWFLRRSEQLVAYVRAGGLSGKILGMALPFLVKVCGVCGKKALYRRGPEGRCSAHKLVPGTFQRQFQQRKEAISGAIDEHWNSVDRQLRTAATRRRLRKSMDQKA